jgi:hypothetical protein
MGALFFASPPTALAQAQLGVLSPVIAATSCRTIEAAIGQAILSENLGRQPYDDKKRYLHPGCNYVPIRVLLHEHESTIPPFHAWAERLDQSAEGTPFMFDGKPYLYRASREVVEHRAYRATYMGRSGRWYKGWVLVPRNPYVIEEQR